MKFGERLSSWFFANPVAWFLVLCLGISIYGNYDAHHHLATVCDDFGDMMSEAPLNAPYMSLAAWQKNEYDEIQNICGTELSDSEPNNP